MTNEITDTSTAQPDAVLDAAIEALLPVICPNPAKYDEYRSTARRQALAVLGSLPPQPAVQPEPASPRSYAATTIEARDLSDTLTDPLRETWTAGKMRHVVAALNGTRVAIVVEKSTGFTMADVRLLNVTPTGLTNDGARVIVESTLSDGTVMPTRYDLHGIGPIVTLDPEADRTDGGPKFRALNTAREEKAAAISKVREEMGDPYGTFTATLGLNYVDVLYTPASNPPPGVDVGERAYRRVPAADLGDVFVPAQIGDDQ